ncbi:MAG TPA: response regulator, partial [Pyrinomonadaceae bacterium]
RTDLATGRKLLVADDSITIQKVVDLTFTDEGMEVTAVGDGEQALARIEEEPPDVVLADVHMPKLGGYEVCERIKRDERLRHIPVMLLVGSFEPFNESEARRVGADDYLTKPFQSIRELIGKVGSLLGGGEKPREETDTLKLFPKDEPASPAAEPGAEALERSTADTAPLPAHLQGEAQVARDAEAEAPPAQTEGVGAEAAEAPALSEAGVTASEVGAAPGRPEQFAETIHNFTPNRKAETISEDEGTKDQVQDNRQPPGTEQTREESYAAPAGAGRYMSSAAEADNMLLDIGEVEPPRSAVEADDFILDLGDVYQKPAPKESAAPESAAPEDITAEQPPPIFESETVEPRAEEFVEAQTTGDEQRASFAEVEEPQPTYAPAPEVSQSTGEAPQSAAAAAEQSAESRPAPAGRITLEQLSPEAVEAIARRAVEMLSESVVREIAWEVVPQLAELLIKRRLEEESSRNR